MDEKNQIALKLILVHTILPTVLIFISFFISNDAYLFLCIVQTVLSILYLSGYWEFFGNTFKIIFLFFLESALIFALTNRLVASLNAHFNLVLILIFASFLSYLIIILAKIIIVIFKKDKEKLEIEFPLKNGKYLITDGGNSKISRLMNYHFHSEIHRKNLTNNSMLYATDVVKTDIRKQRFLPIRNEDYPIFGENVYSPMKGEVVKVENNIEDNEPFTGNYPYNTGNTVVIRNGNYYFLLGHLKKGSIGISKGESVKLNALIGQIGNSGYSERPHLHMQLMESKSENYWFGKGICIQYKGKNLYKNRVVEIV